MQSADPFVVAETRVSQFGITARELEILELIATGLSNREIATRGVRSSGFIPMSIASFPLAACRSIAPTG